MKIFMYLCLIFMFSTSAYGATAQDTGAGDISDKVPQQKDERTISNENACSCCEKCIAARKAVKPHEEATPQAGGCGDCCDRCDKIKKSPSPDAPPEMIRKNRR
jgi:hypothetical protein